VSQFHHNTLLHIDGTFVTVDYYKSHPITSEVRDKLERQFPRGPHGDLTGTAWGPSHWWLPGRVMCPPCLTDLPVCGPRLFFSRLLSAEVLPSVTNQKIFFLKETDLEKGCYVIFVQIILGCKNARTNPKSQMNFVTPTKFKKANLETVSHTALVTRPAFTSLGHRALWV
jgi:hypothetical protein